MDGWGFGGRFPWRQTRLLAARNGERLHCEGSSQGVDLSSELPSGGFVVAAQVARAKWKEGDGGNHSLMA